MSLAGPAHIPIGPKDARELWKNCGGVSDRSAQTSAEAVEQAADSPATESVRNSRNSVGTSHWGACLFVRCETRYVA